MGLLQVASLAALLISATVMVTAKLRMPVLPEGHVTCFRDDPKFDECFQRTLQSLLAAFYEQGVPELSLEPMDPIAIPMLGIEYSQGDDIISNVNVTDVIGHGIRDVKVGRVRSNFSTGEDFVVRFNVLVPRFENLGQYSVDGKFLQMPIRGSGFYNLTMGGVKGTWKLEGKHYEKKGVDHVRIVSSDFRPSVRSLWFKADDLFTGNKQLSEAAVTAVNLFWPIFYELTLPSFSKAWGAVMTERANQVFLRVPFDKLFPLAPLTPEMTPITSPDDQRVK